MWASEEPTDAHIQWQNKRKPRICNRYDNHTVQSWYIWNAKSMWCGQVALVFRVRSMSLRIEKSRVQYPTELMTLWIPLESKNSFFRTRYFFTITLSQHGLAPTYTVQRIQWHVSNGKFVTESFNSASLMKWTTLPWRLFTGHGYWSDTPRYRTWNGPYRNISCFLGPNDKKNYVALVICAQRYRMSTKRSSPARFQEWQIPYACRQPPPHIAKGGGVEAGGIWRFRGES